MAIDGGRSQNSSKVRLASKYAIDMLTGLILKLERVIGRCKRTTNYGDFTSCTDRSGQSFLGLWWVAHRIQLRIDTITTNFKIF